MMTVPERRAYVARIKARAGCADCAAREALEFDHRPGVNKLFNVSYAVARPGHYGDLDLLAEIQKCDVVCKPCHVRRTTLRLQAVREMEAS